MRWLLTFNCATTHWRRTHGGPMDRDRDRLIGDRAICVSRALLKPSHKRSPALGGRASLLWTLTVGAYARGRRELPFPTACLENVVAWRWVPNPVLWARRRTKRSPAKGSRPGFRGRWKCPLGRTAHRAACLANVLIRRWVPARQNARQAGARALACAQNLDQWVEDPAEQIMRADRLVHVEQVEAEQHEDEVGDDDPGKSRHWRALTMWGRQSTLKARLRRSPASQGTGLLQLDAWQTSWCRPYRERGASPAGHHESPNADPRSWSGCHAKNQNSRRHDPRLSSETVNS